MARQKGTLPISANFEPQIAGAFDARANVPTIADLIVASNWTALDGSYYGYNGMTVTVAEDSTTLLSIEISVVIGLMYLIISAPDFISLSYSEANSFLDLLFSAAPNSLPPISATGKACSKALTSEEERLDWYPMLAAPIAKKVIKRVLERHDLRQEINYSKGDSV